MRAQAGELAVRYAAVVELWPQSVDKQAIQEHWIPSLPGEVLPHLYPSRYCESDLLAPVAMEHFGAMWQGYTRVEAICAWVGKHVAFTSGSSESTTTAAQTLAAGRGVCRDQAHLMIALCRAFNIPARFVPDLTTVPIPHWAPQTSMPMSRHTTAAGGSSSIRRERLSPWV